MQSQAFIIYLLITPKQLTCKIQNTIKAVNIKTTTLKDIKKNYTADAANIFHSDFLIKDTELSN